MRYLYTVAFAFFLISSASHAVPINFTDVSATGTYATGSSGNLTTPGDLTVLTDGILPAEWSHWQSATTVSFNQWGVDYDREYFTFDMGSLFSVDDIIISADNNDSYTIESSMDNTNWLSLTTVDLSYGEVGAGMDTLSSISGHSEYVSGLDFAQSDPARYLRIYVDGYQGVGATSIPDVGDGAYSLGEFQAFGVAYDGGSEQPVPVPSTIFIFAIAIVALVTSRQKWLVKSSKIA